MVALLAGYLYRRHLIDSKTRAGALMVQPIVDDDADIDDDDNDDGDDCDDEFVDEEDYEVEFSDEEQGVEGEGVDEGEGSEEFFGEDGGEGNRSSSSGFQSSKNSKLLKGTDADAAANAYVAVGDNASNKSDSCSFDFSVSVRASSDAAPTR